MQAATSTSSRSPGVTISASGRSRWVMLRRVRPTIETSITRRVAISPSWSVRAPRWRATSTTRGAANCGCHGMAPMSTSPCCRSGTSRRSATASSTRSVGMAPVRVPPTTSSVGSFRRLTITPRTLGAEAPPNSWAAVARRSLKSAGVWRPSAPTNTTSASSARATSAFTVSRLGCAPVATSPSTTTTSAPSAIPWKRAMTASSRPPTSPTARKASASRKGMGSGGSSAVSARTKCVERSGPSASPGWRMGLKKRTRNPSRSRARTMPSATDVSPAPDPVGTT